MELSFVIPMFNEEGNVEAIYREIHRVFDGAGVPFELILVNDGSKDGTLAALRKLYSDHSDEALTVVGFSRNFGKEAAILAGLRHSCGDFVCIIDGDLQQRPEVALEMYRRLKEHPETDTVAAFQEERKEGKLLSFFKKSFYRIINGLSDTEFREAASDFRVMRRSVADAILSMKEYYRFTKGIFSWVGFETEFMPYRAEERYSGNSKWSFRKLFRYALDGITGYTTVPLLFSAYAGILLILASFIFLIVRVILACTVPVPMTGTTAILTLLLFLSGLNLLALGIIGHYLAKTYIQGKDRPVYIEKEVLKGKRDG